MTGTQLQLGGESTADLEWMRGVMRDWKLENVCDRCLAVFLEAAQGDRQLAVDAIRSVHGGKTHEPLREVVEGSR